MSDSARPLVFVIGDSISIGYGPYLERYLAPFFRYARKLGSGAAMEALGLPANANGGDSAQVLKYLELHAAHGEIPAVDYLLVNCGLHDIRTDLVSGTKQVEADSYRANLEQIVVAARALCTTFCWTRTTPCDEAVHNRPGARMQRYSADCLAYNAIADSVMQSRGVPSLDLYRFTTTLGPDLYADHVHFPPHIQAGQAAFIAGWLSAYHAIGNRQRA